MARKVNHTVLRGAPGSDFRVSFAGAFGQHLDGTPFPNAVAAFLEPEKTRRLAWVTLGCLTIGGLFLGPVVQKYAFGAYWTGWPVGEDLTDTKKLVMWAGWALAVAVLGLNRPINLGSRVAVLFAITVMIAVYLVPHSVRGSTLDYEKLEEGVCAEDAIKTG